MGLPIGANLAMMHWRRDVFAKAGLAPPRTWREVISVARALNGSDFNNGEGADKVWLVLRGRRHHRASPRHCLPGWLHGDADGLGEYTLCLDAMRPLRTDEVRDQSDLLAQILASITQTQVCMRVRRGRHAGLACMPSLFVLTHSASRSRVHAGHQHGLVVRPQDHAVVRGHAGEQRHCTASCFVWVPCAQTRRVCAPTPQAMTEALDILNELLKWSAVPTGIEDLRNSSFARGACALHFAYADTFKVRDAAPVAEACAG